MKPMLWLRNWVSLLNKLLVGKDPALACTRWTGLAMTVDEYYIGIDWGFCDQTIELVIMKNGKIVEVKNESN